MAFSNTHTIRRIIIKHKKPLILISILSTFCLYYFGVLTHLFEMDYDEFSYPLNLPMDSVLTALKTGRNPPAEPINEFKFPYIISNHDKCYQANTSGIHADVKVLCIIKSAFGNRNRRDAIRKTWASESRFRNMTLKRVFLLGNSNDPSSKQSIEEEQRQHHDIVQGDFFDSYFNNTLKTTMGLKWVFEHCPKSQFVFFADDDMYVSTKNLIEFIRNELESKTLGLRRKRSFEGSPHDVVNSEDPLDISSTSKIRSRKSTSASLDDRIMAGAVSFTSSIRDQSSKWYISLEEYPYSMYPPFINAGAYILSYPAVRDMYLVSMFTKPFKFDDVYLGIIAKKCGISQIHNENFYAYKIPYTREAYKDVIACHGYGNPHELKKIWEDQLRLGHA